MSSYDPTLTCPYSSQGAPTFWHGKEAKLLARYCAWGTNLHFQSCLGSALNMVAGHKVQITKWITLNLRACTDKYLQAFLADIPNSDS